MGEESNITSDKLPGGNYTAVNNLDNTWTIKDVPIMAELKRGEKHTPFDVDRKWLDNAVATATTRYIDGKYLAPLHIHHHDMGASTKFSGFVLPKSVKKIRYDGKQTWAMFADLVNIPKEIFDKIDKGELPYRSVEIASWEKPEINSLALLDDDAPFFRFELLTIGNKVISNGRPQRANTIVDKTPAYAYSSNDKESFVLFNFTDSPGVKEKFMDEAKKLEDKKPEEVLEKKEEKPEEKMQEKSAGSPTEGSELFYLKGMYELMAKMFNPEMWQNPHKEELKPAEQPKPAGKELEGSKMGEDTIAKLGALEGAVAALTEKSKIVENEARLNKMVESAIESLRGYPTSDGIRSQLRLMAEKGEDAVKAFVSAYMSNVPQDPPKTFKEMEAKSEHDPAEVMKYSANTEDLKRARVYSGMYDEAVKHRLTDTSRERFIKIQFERDLSVKG